MKPTEPAAATFALATGGPPPGVHRFSHTAMATVFEVHCVHEDATYARQAAQSAFDLVDRLELDLSRFIANSDISRINHGAPDHRVRVSPWTMECLELARALYHDTFGAFDISLGSGLDALNLDPDELSVRVPGSRVALDLGGIGKGYAVDRMAELLEEWEVPQALVHGGFSSVLALDAPPMRDGWPLTLSAPGVESDAVRVRISARRRALSASGTRKGEHILDPRSGRPIADRAAAWVALPCGGSSRPSPSPLEGIPFPAAVADALSTAFMVLPVEEVALLCRRWIGLEAWLIQARSEDRTESPGLVHLPSPDGCEG
jgi:thiamine biosynthesis lipoprotein